MIPKLQTGKSFSGCALYYLNDKNTTETHDRVEWTHNINMFTQDASDAFVIMEYTAKNSDDLKRKNGTALTGQKLIYPVLTYSLSWHKDQNPTKAHMLATAYSSLEHLGMLQNEAIIVNHNDAIPHIHVIANRVHPETGISNKLSFCKNKLSEWAYGYEVADGKIYCKQRVENREKIARGEHVNYRNPVIQEAWDVADSGKAFVSALSENGYILAQGRRGRTVIVDRKGNIENPIRHIDGVKTKEFQERLADLNLNQLKNAQEVSKNMTELRKKEYQDSRKHDQQSTRKLNQEQDRQIKETAQISRRHDFIVQHKKEELDKFYRPKELQSKIKTLDEKIMKKPDKLREKLQSFLYQVSGRKKRDIQLCDDLQKQKKDQDHRIQEKMKVVENEKKEALQKLTEQHKHQHEFIRDVVESEKPDNYQDEKIVPDIQKDFTDNNKANEIMEQRSKQIVSKQS